MFFNVYARIFFPPTVYKGRRLATSDSYHTYASKYTAMYNALPYDAMPTKHIFEYTWYTTAMLEAPRVEPWLYR